MKKTILMPLAAGCLILVGTATFAQDAAKAESSLQQAQAQQQAGTKKPRLTLEQKVDKEVAKLDEVVHLTPDQQKQVRDLFTKLQTQREQNKATAAGDMQKMKDLNKGLAEQRKEGLKTILTKEQHQALKAAKNVKKAEQMQNSTTK